MKKTIIALIALVSVVNATTIPTEYTVTFADTKTTTLSKQRSHIIFGDLDAETPLSLSSWMIEFSLPSFPDKGVLVTISPANASSSVGFGIRTHGGEQLGILFGDNNGYWGTYDKAESEIFVDASKVTASTPLTLRFAYDSESDLAYLYDVTNAQLITYSISLTDELSSVAATHDGSDVNNKTQFFTQSNEFTFNLGNVYDMSSVAGDNTAFKNFVTTKTIPEPTTATLSLLALAGLAARRRRK